MQSKLPQRLTCPACGRDQPIGAITVDKVLSPSDEESDRENTRIDVLTGEFSTGEAPVRIVNAVDFENILPEPGEALRDRIWQIRCKQCDPDDDTDYWFELDRCETPAKALDWIMHLNDKSWPPIVLQSFIDLMERLFGRE